jgi:hypothetical protein
MFQHVVRTGWLCQGRGGYTRNRRLSRSDTMHANATLTPLMRAKLIQFPRAHHGSCALPPAPSASPIIGCCARVPFAIDRFQQINLNDRFFADSQDIFLHGLLGNRRMGTSIP